MRLDEALGPRTSFRIGGAADLLVRPESIEELTESLRYAADAGLPVRVLGGGSNLLICDEGIDGLVIEFKAPAFRRVKFSGGRVYVACGANLPRLVLAACRRGLGGLVALSGVPGSVGGALRMNAGGKHGEIGQYVRWVDVLDADGMLRRLSHEEAGFRYRASDLARHTILGCELCLPDGDPEVLMVEMKNINRGKRSTQPLAARSAGCIFKNPEGDSAGRIIDALGFKGRMRGDAAVSEVHANFIVNRGQASSDDVLGLAGDIRTAVRAACGIDLEYEIEVWRRAA